MPKPANKIKFGDWLPDLPDLDNPGVLEALNVLPVGENAAGYQPYLPLATSGGTFITSAILSATALLVNATNNSPLVYVVTLDSPNGHAYRSSAAAGSWTDYAPGAGPLYDVVQYNNLVIAADGTPGSGTGLLQQDTSVSPVNFALISGSPVAKVLGVVGQFLMAGDIYTGGAVNLNLLQWSAIGAPTNWPTPGSAAAIAAQSGEQFLHLELGAVTGIFGGDQWGVVLQQNGITRMTYVGGAVVWQFDTLSTGIGMDNPHAGVKIGGLVYFCSSRGLYATDGVSVLPIGEEKVNRWFIANIVNTGYLAQARVGVDWTNKLIVWSFAYSVGVAAPMVIYNFQTGRFAHATDITVAAMVQKNVASFATLGLLGIGQDTKLGTFTGTPGTATLTTAEAELNPGGRAFVGGFRPQVSGSSPSVTCRIGSRFRQGDAVTFTGALTPNSITGFADCLVESAYHRAETDITGAFTQALGGEFLSQPAGAF